MSQGGDDIATAEGRPKQEFPKPNYGWFHSLRVRVFLAFYDPDGGYIAKLYDRWYGPLPDRMYRYISEHAQKNDPDSVIDIFDQFNRTQQWTFCLGAVKGEIVRNVVKKVRPMTCLELGTFTGYSAINAARTLPPGARYVCVEASSERADAARKIVHHAGLQDTIKIVHGLSHDVIPTLRERHGVDTIDYLFLDHEKDLYERDLLMLEEMGFIRTGTVVVADNVITPGAPEYLEYVRQSPKYRSEYFEASLEYSQLVDGVEVSTYVA